MNTRAHDQRHDTVGTIVHGWIVRDPLSYDTTGDEPELIEADFVCVTTYGNEHGFNKYTMVDAEIHVRPIPGGRYHELWLPLSSWHTSPANAWSGMMGHYHHEFSRNRDHVAQEERKPEADRNKYLRYAIQRRDRYEKLEAFCRQKWIECLEGEKKA